MIKQTASILLGVALISLNADTTDLLSLNRQLADEAGISGNPVANFSLGQHWKGAKPENLEPTCVSLYFQPDGLHILATLRDLSIFSNADSINQKTWELGDVFEVFIGIAGDETYYEFHVTPNNQKLQLQWTADALKQFRNKTLPLQNQLIDNPAFFTSQTRAYQTHNYWQVQIFIPLQSLGSKATESPLAVDIAFCRYDATPELPSMLSASAPFPARNFHLRDAWHRIVLQTGEE